VENRVGYGHAMTAEGELWLVRHGETEWSRDGRHTSVTDLPLTPVGERAATALRGQIGDVDFGQVLCSPRRRAKHTAELIGFPDPEIEPDLVEWDYGEYEGITTVEIREQRDPSWQVWTDGCPGGESPSDVSQRCDRVIERIRDFGGRVLAVGHGHSLRALTARWLDLSVDTGARLVLHTSTVSVLGYDRGTAVIERWNA
jgi:broad specificity phosphatase PhoE